MSDPRHFKVRGSLRGGHVHVGIWAGTAQQKAQAGRPKLGDLIMDLDDWRWFTRFLTSASGTGDGTSFVDVELDPTGGTHPEPGHGLITMEHPGMLPPVLGVEERYPHPIEATRDFGLSVVIAAPPALHRVWAELAGAFDRAPGAAGWAISCYRGDDTQPVWTHQGVWADGQDVASPTVGDWVDTIPGAPTRVTVRLDGGLWHYTPIPVRLRVLTEPPPSPGAWLGSIPIPAPQDAHADDWPDPSGTSTW